MPYEIDIFEAQRVFHEIKNFYGIFYIIIKNKIAFIHVVKCTLANTAFIVPECCNILSSQFICNHFIRIGSNTYMDCYHYGLWALNLQ